MIVDTVSPTPFALLRRAKNFEYRDDHWHLQEFANYEDPIKALTDECLRVLRCISSTNESSVSSSKQSTSLRDASWSRFEDIGFGGSIESDHEEETKAPEALKPESILSQPRSQGGDMGRPTTPSWADFMSSGFADEGKLKDPVGPLLLPPDKVLPPIVTPRGQSSQSHKRSLDEESTLEPAELASINTLDLDDSFWWVWITSLSGDEPSARKAVFGRCALLETVIRDTKWLVLEEQVKGAAPEPEAGAQIVEKKRFFSFGSRKGSKLSRRKSSARKVNNIEDSYKRANNQAPQSKTSIGPDQHKRIQAAAAALQKKHREQEEEANSASHGPRDENYNSKTNSVMTLQPGIVNEASSAMKWTKAYDKDTFRAAYLSDNTAGTGAHADEAATGSKAPEPAAPAAPLPPSTAEATPAPPAKDPAATATPLPPSPEPAKKVLRKETPKEKVEEKKEVKQEKEEKPQEKETKKDPVPEKDVEVKEEVPEAKPAQAVVVEQPTEAPKPAEEQEPTKKPQKKIRTTGTFKNMFTTNKKKAEQPPMKSTGAKDASVAAARAALEAKAKAAQDPASPKNVSKKPLPEKPKTPVTPTAAPVEPEQNPEAKPAQIIGSGSPPQTRHAVEQDALSRVDTNERDAADQEFSKFDQGPLVEQPAFVPEDGPLSPVPDTEPEVPKTPTNGHEETALPQVSPESDAPAPSADRWAQIRENAAKRTAATTEESAKDEEEPRISQSGVSQSERTEDDGDTSGEESKSFLY